MTLDGTHSCTTNCYNFFIEPFKQGGYNLRDAVMGEKVERVARHALIVEAPSNRSIPLAERVSRAVIGLLLVIPVINFIAMAILKGIGSELLYGFTPVQPAPAEETELDEPEPAPLTPEQMIARKTEALARLDQIEQMIPADDNPMTAITAHFRCKPRILRFDLDTLLQRYQTEENPSKLLNLMDWAVEGFQPEPGEELSRIQLQFAIDEYERGNNFGDRHVQKTAIRNILKNLVAYFDQKRAGLGELEGEALEEAEEPLKTQFRDLCRKIIDANQNCADQMLSRLQTIAVEELAEDSAAQGDNVRKKILSLAGLALCKYRTNLLKEILLRQNPDEHHMADLERVVFKRVAERLGLQGAIFQAGAVYNINHNVEERTERAIEVFREEYKPTKYLLEQLRTNLGDLRLLRNSIPEWANGHYDLGNEDPQGNVRQPHEMDRRLSEVNFEELTEEELENPAIMSAGQGGNFTPAATALLLETLGLIGQV